jgi:crossover junction endodeoxyribonuclease RuvC
MRILGIDPGTAIVGWAVLEEERGRLVPLAYGHISTSPKNTLSERLVEISRDLRDIIEAHAPDEAAVEELFFFKNVTTAMAVSHARGVILLTLEALKVRMFEYTPLQVKQSLTGYGRAEKAQVQMMVKSVLKLQSVPKPDDTADAIAIALCHINSRKMASLKERSE